MYWCLVILQGAAKNPNAADQQQKLKQAAEDLRSATNAAASDALKKKLVKRLEVLNHAIIQLATKWVETLHPKLDFLHFTNFKGGKYSFSSPIPSFQFVPLFELPIENNKHPNFEWRGQGRGVDSFVLWSYCIWVQCLDSFVADCWLSISFCCLMFVKQVELCDKNVLII